MTLITAMLKAITKLRILNMACLLKTLTAKITFYLMKSARQRKSPNLTVNRLILVIHSNVKSDFLKNIYVRCCMMLK